MEVAVLQGELVVQGVAVTGAQQILLVQTVLPTRAVEEGVVVRIIQPITLDTQAAQAAPV